MTQNGSVCVVQAKSKEQYIEELQDIVEELQAAQSLVQDQRRAAQGEVQSLAVPARGCDLH